jgi:Family of unknown function (DUF5681)
VDTKNTGFEGLTMAGSESEMAKEGGAGAPEAAPVRRHSAPWLKQYAFPKGVSGNPSGRPKEGNVRKTDYKRLFREQMNERGAEVVRACLDKAAAGDPKMIAVALRYLMPEAKADSGSIDLEVGADATMETRLSALVSKISSGEVSVEAGAIASKALRDAVEAAKTLEALQRMDQIQEELRALDRAAKGY